MKCPKCGGTGKEYWNGNVFCNTGFECDKCNGTGEIELVQTNEKWFNSLQTSDKAKYIAKAMYFYDIGMPMGEALRASIRHEQGLNRTLEDDVIEWLKQPHREERHDEM